ncbi:hypothetical protein DIURU_004943 [Diutina rugosa]|uniref:non-specific serine/threonine protein kinase n=1 Tax=Diutina rugosa TaxID=5481 RepID=A0A642UFM5_DIURU|nr:uncharacterized protein DIURU_004943 [Diutina rugosa]KAA8898089.1 hypothetical protein DIURU_004943 [Diutina rugosa]
MGDKSKKLGKWSRLFGIGEDEQSASSVSSKQASKAEETQGPQSRSVTPNQHTSHSHPSTPSSVSSADTKPYDPQGVTRSNINSAPVSRSGSTKKQLSRASSTKSPSVVEAPRFKMLENGNHEHHLRAVKRQEKISSLLKDLLGAKKLRDEAKSAVSFDVPQQVAPNQVGKAKPPTLVSGLVNYLNQHPQGLTSTTQTAELKSALPLLADDHRSFSEKYGRCQEVVGKGSYGVVRLSHKDDEVFAVKEFKRRAQESPEKYQKRLTAEFSIMASLKNLNVIKTYDLLKDAKGDFCEVMEYCAGGDLFSLIIAAGRLEYAEADCFFKQLIRGVNYIHKMGVAHRDLKPENLILTQSGVLKITDFGNSECFKMAWEDEVHMSVGVCGSSPYIAPEEFTQEEFDPRMVDIWACGVIYMAMRTGRQLWKLADAKADGFYAEYLEKRKQEGGYEPIESLKRARCRNVIYSVLDPKPERRITGPQILQSEWGREIKVCAAGDGIDPY